MKIKVSFLSVILIFTCLSLSGQNTISIKDYDGNKVDFFLLSEDQNTQLIAENGTLLINQIETNKNKVFKLHFINHLAYLLFHIDLYNENGLEISDNHIVNNEITYAKIIEDSDGVFYLRRKEIKLDSGNTTH